MKALNLAVIGKDVSGSTSPQIHKFIAEKLGYAINYEKISVPETEFEEKIEGIIDEFDGLNVTIPYKLPIIPHLKSTVGDAVTFGAVNTVRTLDRTGDNTDGLGFWLMLKNNGVDVSGKDVLVLGVGGAGRSVTKKLIDGGATVSVYDAKFENCLEAAEKFKGVIPLRKLAAKPYFAIINATGIGMHKTVGLSPIDDKILKICEVAVDLIYTPPKSAFLQIAEGLGKKTINGEAMLFYQAYYAESIFCNFVPDDEQAKRLFELYSAAKEKL